MALILKNRYKVLRILSEAGGFGQTFLAEDVDTPSHRRCVIKKLRAVDNTEEFIFVQERFQREAAILERLGEICGQIPKLYAYFVENQEFYLVQELIDGLTLKEKVQRQGRLDENAVKELLCSLLTVVALVHEQNIIPRDIKPDNIILRERDNKPVLIDFGIVKEVLRVSADGSPTSSVIAGTPGYTACEQAAGRPVYASDLYSLGATAIYLLTGRNPQQMTDLNTGDIIWQKFAPKVSTKFVTILNKVTEFQARDRYKTAKEMLDDLKEILLIEQPNFATTPQAIAEEETLIRPVIPQPQVKSHRKLIRPLYFVVAILMTLFIAIGYWAYNQRNSTHRAGQVSDQQNYNNIVNPPIPTAKPSEQNTASKNVVKTDTQANNVGNKAINPEGEKTADATKSLPATPVSNIRSINFKKMRFPTKKEQDGFDYRDMNVRKVEYSDLDGDGIEEAIVIANWSFARYGGNGNGDIGYIYKIEGGSPKFVTRFDGGSLFDGHILNVSIRNSQLIVSRCFGDKGVKTISYKLNGGNLKIIGQSIKRGSCPSVTPNAI